MTISAVLPLFVAVPLRGDWLLVEVETEMRARAVAARITEALVAPHNPSGPVATVVSITYLQNLEHAYSEGSWQSELIAPPELMLDGELLLADRPEPGHRLSADLVSEHTR